MHALLRRYLSFLARAIIGRHKPYIIGVTGTVGKTTISHLVAHMLIDQYGTRQVGYSQYHYNGEYGLPLTIIGAKTGGKNPFAWIWIGFVALYRMSASYPKYLVLEYGIDHPGEMDFLLSIARPDIAILTPIEPNHIEQFGNLGAYRLEKLKILDATKNRIVHESLREFITQSVIYYGLGARADVDASDIQITLEGTQAVVHDGRQDYTVRLPVIGAFQVENILPLYPIARILGFSPETIAPMLATTPPETGRSGIFHGKGGMIVIDGTYNGGYLSIREGIGSLRGFFSSHRIAFFLGDMRELGAMTQELHEMLGDDILEKVPSDSDVAFFLVGPMMSSFVAPKLQKKFSVQTSLSSRDMGEKIALWASSGKKPAIVYAKGSQNTIFLEEGLKSLLNTKDHPKLCRQSKIWMRRKERFFRSIETK